MKLDCMPNHIWNDRVILGPASQGVSNDDPKGHTKTILGNADDSSSGRSQNWPQNRNDFQKTAYDRDHKRVMQVKDKVQKQVSKSSHQGNKNQLPPHIFAQH